MGYTHYWRRSADIDPKKWQSAFNDASAIVLAQTDRLGLKVEDREGVMVLNGNADRDEDHEEFYLPRDTQMVLEFDFCKTARKPYDVVVTACLAVFAEAGLAVSSDGDPEDWEPGLELAREVLGRPVANPITPITPIAAEG